MFTIHKSHKKSTISIARGSFFGNPFRTGVDGDRETVIRRFKAEVLPGLVGSDTMRQLIHLHQCGQHLRFDCFCAPLHCHGDTIAEYIRAATNTKILRVIIAGCRHSEDYSGEHYCSLARLSEALSDVVGVADRRLVEVVSGRAKGIDRIGELYAREQGMVCRHFPADWDRHGKAAGPIRNRAMAEFAAQERSALVAFWTGVESGGTWNMMQTARKYNIPTTIIKV